MESRAQPAAVPFDPLNDSVSGALTALLNGEGLKGPTLLLAVGTRARASGWAARMAVFLADALGAGGTDVVLADLSLDAPELHSLVGLDNEEGLSDVFLFGASLEHITLRVPGRSFSLIPASSFTPDTADVLQHQRWSAVFEALAAAPSQLILYLPIDVDGATSFSDRVGHTVVLAELAELEQVHAALSSDADVNAVLVPEGAKPVAPEPAVEPPVAAEAQPTLARRDDKEFERIRIPKDGAREALIADLRARQRAALMAPAPVMTPLPHEEAPATARAQLPRTNRPVERVPIPVFPVRPLVPPKRRLDRRVLWIGGLLLAGAGGAGAWYVSGGKPGAGARAVTTTNAPLPVRPAPVAPPVAGASQAALPYSVAIGSYQVFDLARERLQQLRHDDAKRAYYITPTVAQGTLFYRVMAGPVADSTTALALRDTLLARGIKTGSSGWDVLSTPFAFLLGVFDQPGDAQSKQQDAEKKGVPSYIVESAGEDGSLNYKLYAGAYTGPGDAEFLRPILKSAGLPDYLVARTGSIHS